MKRVGARLARHRRQMEIIKKPKLSSIATAVRLSVIGLSLAHGASQAGTIEVTSNLDDDTGCTLREAIVSINSQDVGTTGCADPGSFGPEDSITFANSLASSNTINLDGSQLTIGSGRNISINASNITGGITIDANQNSRVFYANSATLSTNSIIITNGYFFNGYQTDGGGGIFAKNNSSIVLNNSSVLGSSTNLSGGGIYISSSTSLMLDNSSVSANSTTGGVGGGLLAKNNSSITIYNSTISANSASVGGSIYTRDSDLTLNNSNIYDNEAINVDGGGIFTSYGSVSINNSTISRNSAMSNGGGIAVYRSSISINKSTISGNHAKNSGGGINAEDINGTDSTISLTNSTVSNNYANIAGGISTYNFTTTLTNSTVSNNSANLGGGIFTSSSRNIPITLTNSIIANSLGGDCFSIYTAVSPDITTIIEDGSCGASREGDPGLLPLANNGGATKTHAISAASIARDTGLVNATSGTDQRGRARVGLIDVGAFELATIEVTNNGDSTTGCTLREAIVSASSTSVNNGCSISDGGNLDTNVSITFASNLANTITLTNGQLNITPNSNVLIDASTIAEGITVDANSNSRVFYANSATLMIDNMTIIRGESDNRGGGIYAISSTVNLSNSALSNNSASFSGGGVSIRDSSTINLSNSVLSGNSAYYGGGIYANFSSTVNVSNSTLSSNSADESGSAIYAGISSSISLSNSTLSDNSATNKGGGVFVGSSSINASNSTFSSNSSGTGGGIAARNSSVSLNNTTLSDNSANNNSGGGINVDNSSLTLTNSIIANSLNASLDCVNTNSVIAMNSLIEDGSCGTLSTYGDPGLLPLENNGGPTKTHALRASSRARDKGNLATCTANDQRGQRRNDSDGACDIGAIEFNPDDDNGDFFVIPLGNGKVAVIPL